MTQQTGSKSLIQPQKTDAQPATWEQVPAGTILRVVNHSGKAFHFLVLGVDPTHTFSPHAWLRGMRVTAAGKPVAQITHLHMPDGMREELANIVDCKVVGWLELGSENKVKTTQKPRITRQK